MTESVKQKKLLFVVNDAGFFLSHRLPLACAAKVVGYDVYVAMPDGANVEKVRNLPFGLYLIPMNRMGSAPLAELRSMFALYQLYRQIVPDIVHHITIKPVLYGGLMARLAGVKSMVSAITGLGFVFVNQGLKTRLLRLSIGMAYRFALAHKNSRVIFQNPDDRALFIEENFVKENQAVLIRGSGVDMNRFSPTPESDGTPLVVLVARMIRDKGVAEFVEAARRLGALGVKARFALVGDTDAGNPTAISISQLIAWRNEGAVEWWGHQVDMPKVLTQAHVVCLPSYGEGVPKSLIEAAASGRPIVTTNIPGCRDIVQNEGNGLLVRPRDVDSLTTALRRLIEDAGLRKQFGMRGREIAVARFSIEQVVAETLAVYEELLD